MLKSKIWHKVRLIIFLFLFIRLIMRRFVVEFLCFLIEYKAFLGILLVKSDSLVQIPFESNQFWLQFLMYWFQSHWLDLNQSIYLTSPSSSLFILAGFFLFFVKCVAIHLKGIQFIRIFYHLLSEGGVSIFQVGGCLPVLCLFLG